MLGSNRTIHRVDEILSCCRPRGLLRTQTLQALLNLNKCWLTSALWRSSYTVSWIISKDTIDARRRWSFMPSFIKSLNLLFHASELHCGSCGLLLKWAKVLKKLISMTFVERQQRGFLRLLSRRFRKRRLNENSLGVTVLLLLRMLKSCLFVSFSFLFSSKKCAYAFKKKK